MPTIVAEESGDDFTSADEDNKQETKEADSTDVNDDVEGVVEEIGVGDSNEETKEADSTKVNDDVEDVVEEIGVDDSNEESANGDDSNSDDNEYVDDEDDDDEEEDCNESSSDEKSEHSVKITINIKKQQEVPKKSEVLKKSEDKVQEKITSSAEIELAKVIEIEPVDRILIASNNGPVIINEDEEQTENGAHIKDEQDPDLQNSDSDSDDGHCGQAPWFRRMKQRAKEIIEEQKE